MYYIIQKISLQFFFCKKNEKSKGNFAFFLKKSPKSKWNLQKRDRFSKCRSWAENARSYSHLG